MTKRLEEYNLEKWKRIKEECTYPKPNGIACDVCGSELLDTDGIVLCSMPPKYKVHCPKCGFKGHRL